MNDSEMNDSNTTDSKIKNPEFMGENRLTITICSWNTIDELRICLDSLEKVRDEWPFEVIVVENNSADGSGQMVHQEFPWVILLQQFINLGFCKGHNLALKERSNPHALLLNSDTIVHPGALSASMNALLSNPKMGILGPKLLNPDNSLQFSCRRFPNPVAALFRNTFIGKIFPKNPFTKDYLMQDWDHSSAREVDWVSGAALFLKKEAIDVLGGFDESYYMFCEDVDLCWRAWHNGFTVEYHPNGVITHAIGSSTSKVPNRMIARFHKSMFMFYQRYQAPKTPVLRQLALGFAATALASRAGIFLIKNRIDILRRKFS